MRPTDSLIRNSLANANRSSENDRKNQTNAALARFEPLGNAIGYAKTLAGVLDYIQLFEELSADEVNLLCAQMQCLAAKPGQEILREGDDGDFLVIILTGEVSVVKTEPNDAIKVLAVVGPGASLGEMSLIDGSPRSASCIANIPTDFAVLTRDRMFELIVQNPLLGNKFLLILLQIVSRRLREANEKLLPYIAIIPL